ncbi:hypothetical protein EsH8_III_001086 [Colletotrichum jinshuiense]
MAHSGYPGSAAVAEAPHLSLSLYATQQEQNPFLSPTNEELYQQWLGWDYRVAEPMFSPSNSAGSMSSVQWDADSQGHQQFDAAVTTPSYTPASWAPQSDSWSSYQQHLQLSQSAVFSPPQQWPTPACSPLPLAPTWQPSLEVRSEAETNPRAAAAAKKASKTTRKPADQPPHLAGQQPSKRARVGARCEPSPASSTSYDGSAGWMEDNDEDEEVDVSAAPRGPDKKKTYRVKNRAAAKRCREKTKQYEVDLAAKERQVTQERMYLDSCVTALKNEVLTLKNQILQHGDCDCEIIQGYIARTANSVSVAACREPHAPRSLA